jgi:predicted nucleotidyltransferase
MRPSVALELHREEIRRIVESNRGLNPRVFGSALRGEDTEESDLDILIDAAPRFTLFDMARIAFEIEKLINKQVDVRTPGDLPPKFRPNVVAEAMPI